MTVIFPVWMVPPEPVANAEAWPPAVIVEVAKSKLIMSHWYLVLPDPPDALLASGDTTSNTSTANGTATPINLMLEAPYIWAFGELDGFSPTIVEVETDDGLIGLGETPSPAAAAIINERLASRLIGRDPIDIAGAERVCL